jgi:elongation factor Ts
MVKELRDKTGAGMMDCKRALEAAEGDMEKAIENLRKAGIAKAERKSGRATREGGVVSYINGNTAVLAEVLCETDFVARNAKFQDYVQALIERVAGDYDVDGDLADRVREDETGNVGELVASVGENIQICRVIRWVTEDGRFSCYLHLGGKIGVLVETQGSDDEELLNDVCMHIAAFNPSYIVPEDVPEDVLAKEREIAAAQMAGKPAEMMDKIVQGKISKWYTEVCLTRQPWLRDDKSSLAKLAPKLKVKRFVRWQIGEGE